VSAVVSHARYRCKTGFIREKYLTNHRLNPDRIFYVIRRSGQGGGLISNFHHVLGHVLIAERHGWTPVVDMMNYDWQPGLTPLERRSCNFWERIFEQPGGISVDEALCSKNVILSSGDYPSEILGDNFGFMLDPQQFEIVSIAAQRLMKLQPSPKNQISDLLRDLTQPAGTIGVYSRGTDYLDAVGHTAMPSTDELVERCAHMMSTHDVKEIFLVSEEESVVDRFRSKFGENLVCVNRPRVGVNDSIEFLPTYRRDRDDDNYLTAVEYLAEIIGLSRCGYFLGAIANGSALAIELNDKKYKYVQNVSKGINTGR
jgi:hypothetical protein